MTTVRTVGLIHAVAPAMAPVQETLARELPDVRVLNILDEGLLTEVERHDGVTAECVERLAAQVGLAIAAGASAVLLTCTVYTSVVPVVQARFPAVPVIGIDAAMVAYAVATATCIGVLATVPAGLAQQQELLRRAAAAAGTQVEIVPSLHPEAMTALRRGDGDTHDRILLAALPALAARTELVVLAQASMTRLVPRLPPALPVPVLTSPALAVAQLRAYFGASVERSE